MSSALNTSKDSSKRRVKYLQHIFMKLNIYEKKLLNTVEFQSVILTVRKILLKSYVIKNVEILFLALHFFYKNTWLIFCSKFKNNPSLSRRAKSQIFS